MSDRGSHQGYILWLKSKPVDVLLGSRINQFGGTTGYPRYHGKSRLLTCIIYNIALSEKKLVIIRN